MPFSQNKFYPNSNVLHYRYMYGMFHWILKKFESCTVDLSSVIISFNRATVSQKF